MENLLGTPALPNHPTAIQRPGGLKEMEAQHPSTRIQNPPFLLQAAFYSTQHHLRSTRQIKQIFCSFRLESKHELIMWSPNTLKWNLHVRCSKHWLFLRKLSKHSTDDKSTAPESLLERSQLQDDSIPLWSSWSSHSVPQHLGAMHC